MIQNNTVCKQQELTPLHKFGAHPPQTFEVECKNFKQKNWRWLTMAVYQNVSCTSSDVFLSHTLSLFILALIQWVRTPLVFLLMKCFEEMRDACTCLKYFRLESTPCWIRCQTSCWWWYLIIYAILSSYVSSHPSTGVSVRWQQKVSLNFLKN